MKNAEVPKGAIVGIAVALALVIGYFAFATFAKAPPQVDPAKVSAERLLDPDHRAPHQP
ncbi:hypothetical protein [Fimbriimonas ginsengisoli]|uniref:Uncharacterized protein n=1 Tax=Fimbriimonas ginsengisoli Gsoil 348 TaxID=661478 RepID=A0A068NQ68_FIMGI|nr:hypothetical protein [Fimbriimonas ginsengisoli]AIE83759.1 hypothetical protein OP10G_0391 [Fimbriimonas ginsengisoli Gsoil 348]